MTTKIAAFIPVTTSEQSKECILGVPLFLWAANNLSRVLPRTDIYIDSDKDTVLQCARAYGFQGRKIPPDLMGRQVDMNELLIWQTNQVDCAICIQHFPEMILLHPKTLRKAIQAVVEEYDSAFAAILEDRPVWSKKEADEESKTLSHQPADQWIEARGLYVVRKPLLVEHQSRVAGSSAKIAIDRYESLRINAQADLDFVRMVLRGFSRRWKKRVCART